MYQCHGLDLCRPGKQVRTASEQSHHSSTNGVATTLLPAFLLTSVIALRISITDLTSYRHGKQVMTADEHNHLSSTNGLQV